MSNEQTRKLREASVNAFTLNYNVASILLREAADTIDVLSAKLTAANMKLESLYESGVKEEGR
ncbi:MAG: hypothetical protein K2M91_07050 [Lachnospiraceae bacterium]|nr:hypothetical protein [Lachnospiraceae bacterium]